MTEPIYRPCSKGPCSAEDGHNGTCAEASGFVLTCGDLGCVNGMTVQGRKYDADGNAEDQWAPCGRRADTCPTSPADGQTA